MLFFGGLGALVLLAAPPEGGWVAWLKECPLWRKPPNDKDDAEAFVRSLPQIGWVVQLADGSIACHELGPDGVFKSERVAQKVAAELRGRVLPIRGRVST
jgi:hypothetical protein